MKIVHTYAKNMGIELDRSNKVTFADRWGLVSQVKLGHEVTLICGGYNRKRREYYYKGIKIIQLPTLVEFSSSSRLIKGLVHELIIVNADVFHTHHYCSLIPEITAIIGKLRKIPTFLTVHSSFTGQSKLPGILERLYGILMQPFLQLYSRIIFISKFIKKSKFFLIVPNNKKVVVYNQFFKPPLIKAKRTPNSILFIGRVTFLKGLDQLLRALVIVKKEIPDIRLNVVGDGPKNYKKSLIKLISKYKLHSHVTFHGAVYGKDKWKYFYSNSIQIVPSRGEGFGNVVIEGMLCGLLVLVSNKGALPEALGGNGLVFDFEDPKDIAKKIVWALKDKNYREKISKKAKDYSRKFINYDTGGENVKIYKTILPSL